MVSSWSCREPSADSGQLKIRAMRSVDCASPVGPGRAATWGVQAKHNPSLSKWSQFFAYLMLDRIKQSCREVTRHALCYEHQPRGVVGRWPAIEEFGR